MAGVHNEDELKQLTANTTGGTTIKRITTASSCAGLSWEAFATIAGYEENTNPITQKANTAFWMAWRSMSLPETLATSVEVAISENCCHFQSESETKVSWRCSASSARRTYVDHEQRRPEEKKEVRGGCEIGERIARLAQLVIRRISRKFDTSNRSAKMNIK